MKSETTDGSIKIEVCIGIKFASASSIKELSLIPTVGIVLSALFVRLIPYSGFPIASLEREREFYKTTECCTVL